MTHRLPLALSIFLSCLASGAVAAGAPPAGDRGAQAPAAPAATPPHARDHAHDHRNDHHHGQEPGDGRLDTILAGDWRSPENVARDQYRHPRETLAFFGIAPGQTVIEITPGGGWYAEILAPWLGDGYVAAIVDPQALPERSRDYYARSKAGLETLFAGSPEHYGQARVVAYDPAAPVFGAPGSADAVLTFRNVHNWRGAGQAEGMFKGFFEVLKPGGVLGVVEHRAAGDVPDGDKSGYVGQDQVIALATAAGFRLDAASEVNANPRDTRDHPNGVWTLPPGNRHDEADRAKYRAIGESDRMTLRFVKP